MKEIKISQRKRCAFQFEIIKTILILLLLVLVVCFQIVKAQSAGSQLSAMCDARILENDSVTKIVISEIGPRLRHPFIELWNCRPESFTVHHWYLEGLYSGTRDTIIDTTIKPNDFLVLPLSGRFLMRDVIKVSIKKNSTMHDSLIEPLGALVYFLNDSTHSISFCEWFKETEPTPGYVNACTITGLVNTIKNEKESDQILFEKYFTLIGQEIIDKPPCGQIHIKITYYKNGFLSKHLTR